MKRNIYSIMSLFVVLFALIAGVVVAEEAVPGWVPNWADAYNGPSADNPTFIYLNEIALAFGSIFTGDLSQFFTHILASLPLVGAFLLLFAVGTFASEITIFKKQEHQWYAKLFGTGLSIIGVFSPPVSRIIFNLLGNSLLASLLLLLVGFMIYMFSQKLRGNTLDVSTKNLKTAAEHLRSKKAFEDLKNQYKNNPDETKANLDRIKKIEKGMSEKLKSYQTNIEAMVSKDDYKKAQDKIKETIIDENKKNTNNANNAIKALEKKINSSLKDYKAEIVSSVNEFKSGIEKNIKAADGQINNLGIENVEKGFSDIKEEMSIIDDSIKQLKEVSNLKKIDDIKESIEIQISGIGSKIDDLGKNSSKIDEFIISAKNELKNIQEILKNENDESTNIGEISKKIDELIETSSKLNISKESKLFQLLVDIQKNLKELNEEDNSKPLQRRKWMRTTLKKIFINKNSKLLKQIKKNIKKGLGLLGKVNFVKLIDSLKSLFAKSKVKIEKTTVLESADKEEVKDALKEVEEVVKENIIEINGFTNSFREYHNLYTDNSSTSFAKNDISKSINYIKNLESVENKLPNGEVKEISLKDNFKLIEGFKEEENDFEEIEKDRSKALVNIEKIIKYLAADKSQLELLWKTLSKAQDDNVGIYEAEKLLIDLKEKNVNHAKVITGSISVVNQLSKLNKKNDDQFKQLENTYKDIEKSFIEEAEIIEEDEKDAEKAVEKDTKTLEKDEKILERRKEELIFCYNSGDSIRKLFENSKKLLEEYYKEGQTAKKKIENAHGKMSAALTLLERIKPKLKYLKKGHIIVLKDDEIDKLEDGEEKYFNVMMRIQRKEKAALRAHLKNAAFQNLVTSKQIIKTIENHMKEMNDFELEMKRAYQIETEEMQDILKNLNVNKE